MPTNLPNEKWIEVQFPEAGRPRKQYGISNYGRVMSYRVEFKRGKILRGGIIGGYPSLKIRVEGKDRTYYVHRMVGEYHVSGYTEEKCHLIHLDHNKENNKASNLKWVTKKESDIHQKSNPKVIEARKKQAAYRPEIGHKLTMQDVIKLKTEIWNPSRTKRLRQLAKDFDISEMQLYRIKSGENWGHVRVPHEPESTFHRKNHG